MSQTAERRVAVIGSGAAGLCAAKHLLQAGFDVTVFEMASTIGGLWAYDNDSGRSSAYASLHLNTEKLLTQYSDFPMDPSLIDFPHHTDMRRYLEAYAEHFGVRPRIQTGCEVTDVSPSTWEPGERPSWWVTVKDRAPEEFDTVVIANGHLADPRHPDLLGTFSGCYLHSHAYRRPEPFAGQRVCIIGAGNSAIDIATDLSTVAARVVMSIRSGQRIVPRYVLGVPITRIVGRFSKPWLPAAVPRLVLRAITRVVFGDLTRLGFKPPPSGLLHHQSSATTLVSHVAYGRVVVDGAITSVDGDTITFESGRSEQFDALIAATGYRIDLPMIDPKILAVDEDGYVPLYGRVVPVDWPGLYFVGKVGFGGPLNSAFEMQSRWIVAIETGGSLLPSREQMAARIEAKRAFNLRRYRQTPRHVVEEQPLPYRRQLLRDQREGRARMRRAIRRYGAAPADARYPG